MAALLFLLLLLLMMLWLVLPQHFALLLPKAVVMCELGGRGSTLRPLMKRKRYMQSGFGDIEVEDKPCASGGCLKTPVWLPTRKIDGATLVRIGAREA